MLGALGLCQERSVFQGWDWERKGSGAEISDGFLSHREVRAGCSHLDPQGLSVLCQRWTTVGMAPRGETYLGCRKGTEVVCKE